MQSTLGDYVAFFGDVRDRSAARGINTHAFTISHLGYKAPTWEEYRQVRDSLLGGASGWVEEVHNGRPIAKIQLQTPIELTPNSAVSLIEVMPPKDKVYRRWRPRPGLEHVGFVVGDALESFVTRFSDVLDGRQDQGAYCQPAYLLFDNGTRAKFYQLPLKRVVELEGHSFTTYSQG